MSFKRQEKSLVVLASETRNAKNANNDNNIKQYPFSNS